MDSLELIETKTKQLEAYSSNWAWRKQNDQTTHNQKCLHVVNDTRQALQHST